MRLSDVRAPEGEINSCVIRRKSFFENMEMALCVWPQVGMAGDILCKMCIRAYRKRKSIENHPFLHSLPFTRQFFFVPLP
jgi:hypothetical protein